MLAPIVLATETSIKDAALQVDEPCTLADGQSCIGAASRKTREHVRNTDRLARFVGVDAYEAAGGGIVRDLFAENATLLSDRLLLVRLAGEKLEQAAEPLNIAGWKWVEINLDPSALYNGGYSRIYAETREPTPDEQAELSPLGDIR